MEGKGSVGESLFAAGLGGADLKGLLETLESEAQETIQAGREPTEAERGSEDLQGPENQDPRPFLAPQGLGGTRARGFLPRRSLQADQGTNRADVGARKTTLSGSGTPCLSLRNSRSTGRNGQILGEVKVLRQGFSTERVRTQSENARALSDEKTAQQRIEEIDAEIGNLILPEDLLAQEKTVQGLVEELGSVLKAQKDLPRVQGQVLEANQAAKGILCRAPPGPLPGICRRASPDGGTGRQNQAPRGRARQADRQDGNPPPRGFRSTAGSLPKRRRNLADLPEVRDVSELERSVAIVRRRGDLERAYADAKFAAHSANGGCPGGPEGIAALVRNSGSFGVLAPSPGEDDR